MSSSKATFHDTTGRKFSILILMTSTNNVIEVLDPTSVAKFNAANVDMLATFGTTTRMSHLCHHAEKRLGARDLFLTFWNLHSDAQTQRAYALTTAIAKWKALEAQLDVGNAANVKEWKDQLDLASSLTGVWTEKQKEVLDREDVKDFVAKEEALIAAEKV